MDSVATWCRIALNIGSPQAPDEFPGEGTRRPLSSELGGVRAKRDYNIPSLRALRNCSPPTLVVRPTRLIPKGVDATAAQRVNAKRRRLSLGRPSGYRDLASQSSMGSGVRPSTRCALFVSSMV